MRATRCVVLGTTAALLATAAWLGCSTSSPGDAVDAGAEAAPPSDSPTGNDAPVDSPPIDTETISCDNYCARVMANCAGDAAQYADLGTCAKICAALAIGDAGDTSGNTVACRMYHAGALAVQSPHFHCPHAGPFGGDICGTRCGAFCGLAGTQCPQAFEAGACDASCGVAFGFSPDAGENPSGPVAGDTLNCREHALVLAFGDPAGNCGHIGRTPPADAGVAFPCR